MADVEKKELLEINRSKVAHLESIIERYTEELSNLPQRIQEMQNKVAILNDKATVLDTAIKDKK